MQPSRHKWRSILAEVIELLNDLDPYGLEPGTAEGAPQDEYESEASPIVSLLLNNGSVSRNEVDAIWEGRKFQAGWPTTRPRRLSMNDRP